MNLEHSTTPSRQQLNEVELEAATNASFDAWTKGARDFLKGARRIVENLDDHGTMLLSDIFGPEVAREHSRKLELEASRESDQGHDQAAHHYQRRALNFCRGTLGEFDQHTVDLGASINPATDIPRSNNYKSVPSPDQNGLGSQMIRAAIRF